MKIAIFEVGKEESETIKNVLSEHETVLFEGNLQDKLGNIKDFECVSVRVYSRVDKELIDSLPNLKLIAIRGTGFDNVDVKHAVKRGIAVCNVPRYGESAVAEHAFALILALAKNIVLASERTKNGNFSLDGLEGVELKDKIIGLIGCGNIGRKTAQIANGFGMKILVYDTNPDTDLVKSLGVKYVDYDYLLANSDILSFHAPLSPNTKHMFNKYSLKIVKKGVILINTARGEIVETEAILIGLQNGIIKAAGLDVLEEECFVKEEIQLLSEEFAKTCNIKTLLEGHLLTKKDNVIITPHSAFYSKEALERKVEIACQNILSFIDGHPINIITV
ncbi:MAG: hydroxyacid dehydrogenase [Candidatus Nealsonbacteria bacterium]|nr:hydroxyacid dehydrogenase [Candidatus Nealsonbacteria bacterium]